MQKFWGCGLIMLVSLLAGAQAHGEYRAYELEVYDRIEKKTEILKTTFSPSDYLLLHGGSQRISIVTRASWICWGDTSQFKEICPPPDPISPRFSVGDQVQVVLKRHVTDQWVGVIENVFYRPDLRSNVYGIRFKQQKNLYARYYEANLQAAAPPK
ncbi:MAG: hypothetical protein HQM13_09580 [SAR324 cluster bacterium]|nr:hypothetical protein [SAR324 cluster bacterium]